MLALAALSLLVTGNDADELLMGQCICPNGKVGMLVNPAGDIHDGVQDGCVCMFGDDDDDDEAMWVEKVAGKRPLGKRGVKKALTMKIKKAKKRLGKLKKKYMKNPKKMLKRKMKLLKKWIRKLRKKKGKAGKMCCQAMSVTCMQCKTGKSKAKLCAKMPSLSGCSAESVADENDSDEGILGLRRMEEEDLNEIMDLDVDAMLSEIDFEEDEDMESLIRRMDLDEMDDEEKNEVINMMSIKLWLKKKALQVVKWAKEKAMKVLKFLKAKAKQGKAWAVKKMKKVAAKVKALVKKSKVLQKVVAALKKGLKAISPGSSRRIEMINMELDAELFDEEM